jgi:hypothetical protein
MKKPRLYTTPFVVAWIMLIIGLLGAFNLAYLPLIISDYDGMSGGFAIAFVGGFIAIMGIVVFGVYGKLNRDFARMLAGDTLLTYVMPADIYAFFSRKQAEDIKQNNKMVLIMILGFCVLFGVIFGLAVDTLFIIIFLCIAVFFTIVYFLATAVRTKKVKKSLLERRRRVHIRGDAQLEHTGDMAQRRELYGRGGGRPPLPRDTDRLHRDVRHRPSTA